MSGRANKTATAAMRRRVTPRSTLVVVAWLLVAVGVVLLGTPPFQLPFWGAPGALALWAVAFTLVAQLILRHRPTSPVGWRLLVAGVLTGATLTASEAYVEVWVSDPWRGYAGTMASWIWAPAVVAMATAVLRFPDGTLPSPRWRRVEPALWAVAGTLGLASTFGPTPTVVDEVANPLTIAALSDVLRPLGQDGVAVYVPLQVGLALCIAAPFARHHRATGAARQQLRLLAAVMGLLATIILGLEMASLLAFPQLVAVTWVTSLAVAAIPVAVGVAILRHRMYDAERLISRTVGHVILTLVLAAVYASSVVLLQLTLRPVAADNDVAVAASTLAVAALFGPLRRRVQLVVDRRFNRAHVDARRTAEDFGQRLRDEVDLASVTADLVGTTERILQPTSVSIWFPTARNGPVTAPRHGVAIDTPQEAAP